MFILDEIREKITHYCILPSEEAYDAVALWCAATHMQGLLDFATRLCFTAPEMRCGKSRALKLAECFSCGPISSINSSVAVLVADIDENQHSCTLILDEYDQWLAGSGPLVGILNGGFEPGKPYRRMENGARIAKNTFAMAALAGIGPLPPTMADRSIVISLRRRAPDEMVKPFRRRRDELPLRELGLELAAWVESNHDLIRATPEPALPVEDRAADLWCGLARLAVVATAAQGLSESNPKSWLYRARQAMLRLTSEADAAREASEGQRLLMIIAEVFEKLDQITSEDLVAAVIAADPDTFPGLTKIALSSKLRPFGVRPASIRLTKDRKSGAGATAKGYKRDMFTDVWKRYLPNGDGDGTKLHSVAS